MSEEDRFEILCRDRQEFVDDYLMVVSDENREYCEQIAIVFETLQEDPYPKLVSPKESLIFD